MGGSFLVPRLFVFLKGNQGLQILNNDGIGFLAELAAGNLPDLQLGWQILRAENQLGGSCFFFGTAQNGNSVVFGLSVKTPNVGYPEK